MGTIEGYVMPGGEQQERRLGGKAQTREHQQVRQQRLFLSRVTNARCRVVG